MIGLIRNMADAVTALHRTNLPEQPDKVTKAAIAKPRMMRGKTSGGTVRLGAITAQGLLGPCEGIETGLAVLRACPSLPVLAVFATRGMKQAQLPLEAGRIVTGCSASVTTAGRADEALRKRIIAKLRQLPALMLIDNLRGEIGGAYCVRKGSPNLLYVVVFRAS